MGYINTDPEPPLLLSLLSMARLSISLSFFCRFSAVLLLHHTYEPFLFPLTKINNGGSPDSVLYVW